MPASAVIRRSRRSWSGRADADGDTPSRLAKAGSSFPALCRVVGRTKLPAHAGYRAPDRHGGSLSGRGLRERRRRPRIADRGDRPSRPRHDAGRSRRAPRLADFCHQCLAACGRASPPCAAATPVADAARHRDRNADRSSAADRRCRPSSDDRTWVGAHRLRALGPQRDAATGVGPGRTMALAPRRRGHGGRDRRDGRVRSPVRSVSSGARPRPG